MDQPWLVDLGQVFDYQQDEIVVFLNSNDHEFITLDSESNSISIDKQNA